MRIGIDGRGIYPEIDGIGRYSLNFIRALAAVDSRHEYVVFKNRGVFEVAAGPNFREVELPFGHLSLQTPLWLPFKLKGFRLDVFHSLFFVAPLWAGGALVVTVHDLMALSFPGFFGGRSAVKERLALAYHRLFVPASVRRAAKVIAVSEASKRELVKRLGLNGSRIEVIYEAVDERFSRRPSPEQVEDYRRRQGLPPEYLLYVGNFKPYKNLPTLIKALALLKQGHHWQGRLALGGKKDRFYASVWELARREKVLDSILFLDYVSDDELPLLLAGARLFVFPSLQEGFGLPPLEAMSFGVPTIVSRASSLPEVVGDGAILVDPLDAEGLAESVWRLLNDEALRQELSGKGIEQSRRFSWAEAARKAVRVYEEVALRK